MRRMTAVFLLAFCPAVVFADGSDSPGSEDSSCTAVEEFQLDVYGFGGAPVANSTIRLEAPFRAVRQFPFMSVVFHGVLHRTNLKEYTLDLMVEEFRPGMDTDRNTYRKELHLNRPEDLATQIYYGVRVTRSK